ncbi:hypothetical protein G6644_00670 [Polynucleobacter paneuropaeus]|nr:hypothetical protein [Polynucleobacter paneuropaeus]MBT8637574.1 hypothetical protein [Polynucleobacter paneuropaeus]
MPLIKKLVGFLASPKFLAVLLASIAILGSLLAYNNRGATPSNPVISNAFSPGNYQFGETPPISLGKLSDPTNSYINLHLNFYASNLDGYQNIFQTAPGNEGLRLEISGSTAALVLADKLSAGGVKGLTISTGIDAKRWYALQVVAKNGSSISATLNGIKVIDYKSPGIELKGSDVLIGQGYDQSRQFHGLIKNITFEDGAYANSNAWGRSYSTHLLVFLCTLCILNIFLKRIDQFRNNIYPSIEAFNIKSSINILALLTASIYFYGAFFSGASFGIVKWIFLIVIAFCYPLYELDYMGKISKHPFNKFIFVFGFVLYNIFLIKNNLVFFKSSTFFLLINFLILYSALLISILRKKLGFATTVLYSLIFNLVLIQTFNLVSQLSNWTLLTNNYENFPIYSTLLTFLSISLIACLLFMDAFKSSAFNLKAQTINAINLALGILSTLAFLFISFRHDSLFNSTVSGSPIYHWEYYAGVIRSIQHGGWLLWDTPSQYGFLNLAIASIFSPGNPYESFYLFQGSLLFITSSSLFLAISHRFALSPLHRTFLFSLIFFSLFFADIEFIGPYPFPSSSVVRFFGAYLIITIFCIYPKFGDKQRYLVSLIFPLTFFWSAESAVYSTSIVICVLTTLFIYLKKSGQPLKFFIKYLSSLVATYALALIIIILFYKIRLGHLPDFTGFFEYASGYASGFGYVPLKAMGPGNILLLIFIGVISLITTKSNFSNSNSNPYIALISACAGCMWGISTYYFGRPVAQNITAILPLLVIVLFITSSASRGRQLSIASIAIRTIAIPIFFISLLPLWSPDWLSKTKDFKFFTKNIETSIPLGQAEIEKHLSFLKSKGEKNIIFYGDGDEVTAPNPYQGQRDFFIFSAWLPTPLQLLEAPIQQDKRKIYLTRYICNHDFISGAIIRRGNAAPLNDRFDSLSNDIESLFKAVEIFNTENYTTVLYRKILPVKCTAP